MIPRLFAFVFVSASTAALASGIPMPTATLILVCSMVGVAIICLAVALRAARKKLLIDDLPTSKTTGVFIGTVELKGNAVTDAPLEAPYSRTRCVYFRYSVQERWSREEQESYTDSDGRQQTRTVTKSGWTQIESGDSAQNSFYLKDDRGVIRVWPKSAEVVASTVLKRTVGRGDPLYNECAASEISDSDHLREFRVEAIQPLTPIYLVGHARQRQDIVAAEIAAHPGEPLFLISVKSEEKTSSGWRWTHWGAGFVGLAALVGFLVWLGHDDPAHAPTPRMYGNTVACYLAAWIFGWFLMVYNALVNLRQRVRQGWANIDVELKRRADLIPNLVQVVEGARAHEANVQATVAALRVQANVTAPGQPGADPAAVAAPLRVIAEAYPDLKASAVFLKLQKQLADTEDRIALARSYFNEIAAFWNARIESFPALVVAVLTGMRPRELMAAAGFEREPVKLEGLAAAAAKAAPQAGSGAG